MTNLLVFRECITDNRFKDFSRYLLIRANNFILKGFYVHRVAMSLYERLQLNTSRFMTTLLWVFMESISDNRLKDFSRY